MCALALLRRTTFCSIVANHHMMVTGQLVVYCSVAAALRGGPRIAKAPRRRARAKAGAALSAAKRSHLAYVVESDAIASSHSLVLVNIYAALPRLTLMYELFSTVP